MKLIQLKLIGGLLLAAAMCFADATNAATEITLGCTPPTTRVDGSVFSAADIGNYLFQMTQPAQPLQSLGQAPTCSFTYSIPKNSCVKAGTVFGASVSDALGQWSDPGTATLTTDACNALPKPAKPVVTITVK